VSAINQNQGAYKASECKITKTTFGKLVTNSATRICHKLYEGKYERETHFASFM
jgi:hypothetical protein